MPTTKVDVALLLVSELVSNAVRHGTGTVVLVVARDAESVRVEVHDEGLGMPVVVEPEPMRENGAGMWLVAALSSRWGVDLSGDGQPGKSVWFTVD